MIETNYILPICSFGRTTNYIFSAANSLADHDLSIAEIENQLSSERRRVLIPSHLFERTDFHETLLSLKQYSNISISLSAPAELDSLREMAPELVRNDIYLDICFQQSSDLEILSSFPESFLHSGKIRWLLLANKLYDFDEEIKKMPIFVKRRLFVCFLCNTDAEDIYLNAHEIAFYLNKLESGAAKVLVLDSVHNRSTGFYKKTSRRVVKQGGELALLYLLRELIRLLYQPEALFKQKAYQARDICIFLAGTLRNFITTSVRMISTIYYRCLKAGALTLFYRTRNLLILLFYRSLGWYHQIKSFLIYQVWQRIFFYGTRNLLILLFYRGLGCYHRTKSFLIYQVFQKYFGGIIMPFYRGLLNSMFGIYYHRMRIFFFFYKVYWILEYRLQKKMNSDERQ